MGYYGQPIIEGLRGLGQSIRQYGQTEMRGQVALGQQQVEMAKMGHEAPLRQMQYAKGLQEFEQGQYDLDTSRREQEALKQPVDLSGLPSNFVKTFANVTGSQYVPDSNQIMTAKGPLTHGDVSDEETQKLAFATKTLLDGPSDDTAKGHQDFLNRAYGMQSYLGQVGVDPKLFKSAFPRVATSQARVTELGKEKKDTPKTAMAAFLKGKPDATPEEITGFAQGLLKKGGEVGSIARRKKALKEAYPNLDDQTITGLATKTIKTSHNPITNEVTLVDMVKMTARPLGAPPEAAKSIIPNKPAPGIGPTIFDLREHITGPASAAKQAYSTVAGMVGLPIAETTTRARQFATTSQMALVRALSINRRFPVGEMTRIREEIKIAPAILDNPKMLQQRIRSIDRSLRIRLKKERDASVNTRLPAQDRGDAESAAKDIENFLKILGNPASFTDPNDPEFQALPKGSPFYFGDELMEKN